MKNCVWSTWRDSVMTHHPGYLQKNAPITEILSWVMLIKKYFIFHCVHTWHDMIWKKYVSENKHKGLFAAHISKDLLLFIVLKNYSNFASGHSFSSPQVTLVVINVWVCTDHAAYIRVRVKRDTCSLEPSARSGPLIINDPSFMCC